MLSSLSNACLAYNHDIIDKDFFTHGTFGKTVHIRKVVFASNYLTNIVLHSVKLLFFFISM